MKFKIIEKTLNLIVCSLVIVSCAGKTTKEVAYSVDAYERQEKAIEEFDNINKLFDAGQYADAAPKYDALLRNSTVNNLDALIVFNAGLSYFLAGDCVTASERFREVVRRTKAANSPAMRARALLKLGESYVCLGEDNKAIVNLLESYNSNKNMPIEIGKAELPARLAAAYARIGNRKMAEAYFRIAERGLIEVQIKTEKNSVELKKTLAKTLYTMGTITQIDIQKMSGDDYFETLRALQKYLYKAIEMEEATWSQKAYEDLNWGYNNLWKYVEDVRAEAGEDRISAREIQSKKLVLVQNALVALKSLYYERIPREDDPQMIQSLVAKMQQHESRMRNYIATNIVGSSLTASALEAQSIQSAGRVLNPDPILERQAVQRTKKDRKKPTQKMN
jgi:tetratricopeptide (TPR) repeat protein